MSSSHGFFFCFFISLLAVAGCGHRIGVGHVYSVPQNWARVAGVYCSYIIRFMLILLCFVLTLGLYNLPVLAMVS